MPLMQCQQELMRGTAARVAVVVLGSTSTSTAVVPALRAAWLLLLLLHRPL